MTTLWAGASLAPTAQLCSVLVKHGLARELGSLTTFPQVRSGKRPKLEHTAPQGPTGTVCPKRLILALSQVSGGTAWGCGLRLGTKWC